MNSKTRRTLALIDALMGIEHVNQNPRLMAENQAAWRARFDERLRNPASSPADQRRFLDGLATFEWALKQEGRVFGPSPFYTLGHRATMGSILDALVRIR
jgi:hypothetical protein